MDPPRDNTHRYDDKVDDYVAHRPSYPPEVLDRIATQYPTLSQPGSVIVDVGSGTGILTKLLLDRFPHATVYGVEPNGPMRAAMETYLAAYSSGATKRFVSVDGTAEKSTLPSGIADVIVAGTAAHWFDLLPTREEWKRIGKENCGIVLAWNTRVGSSEGIFRQRAASSNPVMEEYDDLLTNLSGVRADSQKLKAEMGVKLKALYGVEGHQFWSIAHSQLLTLPQLIGRFMSASYAPPKGTEDYDRIQNRLTEVFRENIPEGGKVEFEYEAVMISGSIE